MGRDLSLGGNPVVEIPGDNSQGGSLVFNNSPVIVDPLIQPCTWSNSHACKYSNVFNEIFVSISLPTFFNL